MLRQVPRQVWRPLAGMALLLVVVGIPAYLAASNHPPTALVPLASPSPGATSDATPSPGESPSPGATPSADASPTADASPVAGLTPLPTVSPADRLTPSPAPPQPSPIASPVPTPTPTGASCLVAGGLPASDIPANFATALAVSPDGRLWWAERNGAINYWAGGSAHTFTSLSVSTSGERGLLGLALSTRFCTDHFVYAFYSDPNGTTEHVGSWVETGGVASAYSEILTLPAGGDCCHKGGRLAFSPAGNLLVSVGDEHFSSTGSATGPNGQVAPQDPGDPRGKVLRVTGTGAWTAVVRGLRNPFGIAYDPSGNLALTNNGPSGDAGTPCGSCGDEFYYVGGGSADYQWPFCWGNGHPISPETSCHSLPNPSYSAEGGGSNGFPDNTPFFVAPTGVGWVNGAFDFCTQSPGRVMRWTGSTVADTGVGGCTLDVKQGAGSSFYTSDSNTIHYHP